MKRKHVTSVLLSFVLAASAFCAPLAQMPAYAAEDTAVEEAAEKTIEETAEQESVEETTSDETEAVETVTKEAESEETVAEEPEAVEPATQEMTEEQVAKEADPEETDSAGIEETVSEDVAEAQDLQEDILPEEEQDLQEDILSEEEQNEAFGAGAVSFMGIQPAETEGRQTIPEDNGGKSSDDLFTDYVENSFGIGTEAALSGRKKAKKSAASSLTGSDRAVYDNIAAGIPLIAAGERASTVFEIGVDELGLEQTFWTAEELGIASVFSLDENGNIIVNDEGYASISEEAMEAIDAKTSYDLSKVISALLADHPYQLYWYQKTSPTRATGFQITAFYDDAVQDYVAGGIGSFTISFPVADEYSAGEYLVDTSIGQSVQASVESANDIVTEHSGETDYEKLCSYREEICDLVSYNYEAAEGGVSYGNPWQMIWVFDGDPDTNVVCEGYSKAFQYLCDRSDFSDGRICAYSVTGTMTGGTGAGPHMWNIVTLDDGKHYLADITNSDSGTAGEEGGLFLAPYTSGSVQDGYTFRCGGDTDIHYEYDEDTFSIYPADDLTISAYAYGQEPLEIMGQPQDVNAEAGEAVVLHVEANKSSAAYQWQWSSNGTTWKNCTSGGCKTDTFSFVMKATLSGRQYRCKVTSGEEMLTSEAAQITLLIVPLEITSQPQDVSAEAGETVVLHVEANKGSAAYQWQWSSNGTTWKNCTSGTYNTDTFSFAMKTTLSGRQYRCKVTAGEESLTSEAAQITLLVVPLEIISQPQDVNSEAGETVVLHVEANKSDAAYQWQWSTNGTTWKNCSSTGYNTDTFSFVMKATLSSRRYRCKVTSGGETLISEAAQIILLVVPLEITGQPQDVSAEAGETVVLNVETNKSNVTYQWQWSTNGTTWKNCTSGTYNTDTFSFVMKATLSGRRYRCKVTQGAESVFSENALITFVEPMIYRGSCGDSATWTVDPATETLTIDGTGEMWDFTHVIPWNDYKSDFNKVIVKGGITHLSSMAFSSNENITSVILPEGLLSIGQYAFWNCSSLRQITIPSSVSCIETYAFMDCTNLKSIEMPANITRIENYTFCYCYNLENITIPDGVTAIDRQAFYYCSSLRSINLPDSVTSIGDSAFEGCKELTDIYLPSGIETMGNQVFDECFALTDINVSPDNEAFSSVDGILYDENVTALIKCPSGHAQTEVVIPNSVTKIRDRAFLRCRNLVNVNIPENVTRIEAFTFYRCENLSNIVLPDGVSAVGEYAFDGCGITSVQFTSSLTKIERSAFGSCDKLVTCYYDGTMAEWEAMEVGENNDSLRKYTRIICSDGEIEPSLIWDITDGVFTLSGTGETEEYAWYGDDGITAPWSERRDEITKVVINEGITGIYGPMFACCWNLTEVSLPSTLKKIGNTVFDTCWILETITIPEGVESIGACAFWSCYELKTIYIPQTVTDIGQYAFFGCPLTDIYYSGSMSQWQRISGLQSASITENVHMHFETAEQYFGDWGYDLVNGECIITSYKGSDTIVTVPDTVEGCPVTEVNISPINSDGTRNDAVFEITSITLPDSVRKLDDGAFRDWDKLKTITGLSGVQYVGEYCFSGSGVTSLEFSEALSYAGLYAFDANDLRSITIPDTLRWDGSEGGFNGTTPFLNHENLESINLIETGNPPVLAMVGPALYTANMIYLVCYPGKNPLRTYRIPDGVYAFYPLAFDIREIDSTEGLYELYVPSSVGSFYKAFYDGIYVEKPDGTFENVIMPRLIVEEGSYAHYLCTNSDCTYYWRLADSE